MRVLVQRVRKATVTVANEIVGSIHHGYVVFLGVHKDDTPDDLLYLVKKVSSLRVMADGDGKMNKGLIELGGEILLVSQFTLLADTRRGNRPGFEEAAPGPLAKSFYEKFTEELQARGIRVATGIFGADMLVSLENDGPVTIFMDSFQR